MNAAVTQLEIVKHDIVRTKAKLEKAEQDGNTDLVIMYGNLLTELYKEKQRLESSGIVLNLKTIHLYSSRLKLWYIIIYVFVFAARCWNGCTRL
jgi:hypothetical protein